MGKRDFLTLLDFTPEELAAITRRASAMKRDADTTYRPLTGRTAALILQLNSTRTRVAFEVGIAQLGGHMVFLSPKDTQFGRGEPIEDTARVLSHMVDIVIIRTPHHDEVVRFAEHASVPVINAMTDRYHPCQLLADVQTYEEQRGSIQGKTVAWIGDGYNMCNSYINAARQWGFQLKIASPTGYAPSAEMLASTNHASLVDTPAEAVAGADLVVTDVWSSMGHEGENQARLDAFAGFQVDESLLDGAAKDALFMHCLPAHRGEEVNDTVLDDPRSVVFEEAGNRLHSQKALVEFLLTP